MLAPALRSDIIARSSIEVIIGDDSPEPLLSCIEVEQYALRIDRFQYIHNVKPLGAVKNWNYLVSLCHGEFYWICHHDEYMADTNHALQYLLQHIRNNEADIFIFPLFKSYRFDSIFLLQCHTPLPCMLQWLLAHASSIIYANPIGPPSCLILRSSIPIAYDVNLTWYVDVEYYTRLFVPGSHSVSILPYACKLVSDQNYEQSITRSLAPTLLQTKTIEAEYLANSCSLFSARDLPPLTILFIKTFLFTLRSIRTRLIILKRSAS